MSTDTLRLILQIFTAMCGAGGLGLILKYKLGTKKLDLDSEEAIRDHYATEVARLTKKLDDETSGFRKSLQDMESHYRRMLEDSDRRHDECQKDRDRLRQELNNMHEEIRGLKRQIAQYSSNKLIELEARCPPSESAPEAAASAERVKRVTNGEND